MPKLSIIIPTKNEENELPSLFDSLHKQTFKDYEVIVSDAKSEDNTRAIAQKRGAVVVDGGLPGFGRNAGAKIATGELLLFLDADVVFNIHFLENMVREFTKRNLSAATSKVDPKSTRFVDKLIHEFVNGYISIMQYIDPHAGGMCIMVQHDLHKLICGFDTSLIMAEDHDYVRRISRLGHGPFRIFKSVRVTVSVRRLETDGRLGLAFKYLIYEFIQKLPKRLQYDPWKYMRRLGGKVTSSGDDE